MSPKNTKNEDLWVDFLENEVDETLRSDLEHVLKNSKESSGTLKDLEKLRSAIRTSSQDVQVPEDPAYYEKMHDRIMGEVKKTNVQSPVVVQLFSQKVLRIAAAVALIVVSSGVLWNAVNKNSGPTPAGTEVAKSSNWFLESTARNPEVVPQTEITNEGEVDIIMDATAEKLDGMSEQEAERLLKRLAD